MTVAVNLLPDDQSRDLPDLPPCDLYSDEPESLEFQGFCLVNGRYQALEPNEQGWVWSEQLGLFLGIQKSQLRYFTAEGMVPTPAEAALLEQQQRQMAEQRADRLAAKLREAGIDPEAI